MKHSVYNLPQKNGFTLIELMIVIVIAAILLTIAVPSFDSMIKKNNVEALQSRLASAVSTARTEAASRNSLITICASINGTTCEGTKSEWGDGWIIFENDGNNSDAADKIVIDVFESDGEYTIVSGNVSFLTFESQGYLLGGEAENFAICDPVGDEKYARGLFVNTSGLIVKTKDTNNDGIHNNLGAGGGNLSCP